MNVDSRLKHIAESQPYPLLFATISGAHLYGFPSADSDFDPRCGVRSAAASGGWPGSSGRTVQDSRVIKGQEMDIVSHDVRKFILC